MGFVFACGFPGFQDLAGREYHTSGLTPGRRMGAVMVRIGAPRELKLANYEGAPANFKRDLGAYISPRDITQLFVKSIETPNIDNEHGIPWQVVYGISNNTRAFWSLWPTPAACWATSQRTTRRSSSPRTSPSSKRALARTPHPAGSACLRGRAYSTGLPADGPSLPPSSPRSALGAGTAASRSSARYGPARWQRPCPCRKAGSRPSGGPLRRARP